MNLKEPTSLGRRCWAIAEGYIPAWSNGPEPELQSHETCCILNTGSTDAAITLTLYFEDRDPQGPYRFTVPARRTCHKRFNDLEVPAPVPVAWVFRASSNPMFQSSSSTRGSIHAKPRTAS